MLGCQHLFTLQKPAIFDAVIGCGLLACELALIPGFLNRRCAIWFTPSEANANHVLVRFFMMVKQELSQVCSASLYDASSFVDVLGGCHYRQSLRLERHLPISFAIVSEFSTSQQVVRRELGVGQCHYAMSRAETTRLNTLQQNQGRSSCLYKDRMCPHLT
jgi:hypothetical protein